MCIRDRRSSSSSRWLDTSTLRPSVAMRAGTLAHVIDTHESLEAAYLALVRPEPPGGDDDAR